MVISIIYNLYHLCFARSAFLCSCTAVSVCLIHTTDMMAFKVFLCVFPHTHSSGSAATLEIVCMFCCQMGGVCHREQDTECQSWDNDRKVSVALFSVFYSSPDTTWIVLMQTPPFLWKCAVRTHLISLFVLTGTHQRALLSFLCVCIRCQSRESSRSPGSSHNHNLVTLQASNPFFPLHALAKAKECRPRLITFS